MARIKEDLFYTWEDDYQTRDGNVLSKEEVDHYGLERHVILEKEKDEEPDEDNREGEWMIAIPKDTNTLWSIDERKWMVIDVYGDAASVRPQFVRMS